MGPRGGLDQVLSSAEAPLDSADVSHSALFCLELELFPGMEDSSNANITKHSSRFCNVAT